MTMESEATLSQSGTSSQPAPSKAQMRRAEKERETAEKMRPRSCKLPACGIPFTPKRVQDWKSEFCCREHQAEFWVQANRTSAAMIASGGASLIIPASQLQPGVSHREQVLEILERSVNQWVGHPRELLPGVMWNSRVADLRRQGYDIKTRTVGERPNEFVGGYVRRRDQAFVPKTNWRKFLPGGNVEYQYMLVRLKEANAK